MIRILTAVAMFIASMIGDDDRNNSREYVVFENHVHDSLFIGIYGKGHVQRVIRDSISKNMSLRVSLNKEEQYSGLYMALKNPVDISETSDIFLSFRVKGARGKENIYVSLKDTYKENGDYDLQVSRRISDFAEITDQWQEFNIPLDSFPVKGENWNRKAPNGKSPLTGVFDWTEVNSISFSKPDSMDYTFYLDDVKIIKKDSQD